MMYEDEDSKGNKISKQTINVSNCRDTQIVFGDGSLSSIDDENSVVAFFLDTFNFKRFIETIANSQKRFKITHNFINIILLLFFLTFVFWQADVLKLEKISTTLTLVVLGICAILEFLGANTSIFKGLFDNDLKTKKFIDRLSVLSNYEIKNEVKSQDFSPKCLNYFIEGLRDVNKYPQNIVYLILDSKFLRKQNLDLLFSTEIIKNISKKIILRILFKKRNSLTQNNILNIYSNYSEDKDVVKILIATQDDSDFLIKCHPEDSELSVYYQRYQKEKVHLDWTLKIIPINKLSEIIRTLCFLVWFALIGLCFQSLYSEIIPFKNPFLSTLILVSIVFVTLIIAVYFNMLVLVPVFAKIYNHYYKHMLRNILK